MKQRFISAVILIAGVLACFIISPYTRELLLLAFAVISIHELCNVYEKMDMHCSPWVLYLFVVGFAVLSSMSVFMEIDLFYYLGWMFLAMFLSMFEGIRSEKIRGKGAIANCAILTYPLFPFAAMMVICVSNGWQAVVVIACLATWICDTFALFGGKLFGKHKVAPYTSPNKTIEGCLCGAASSVLAGLLAFVFLKLVHIYVPVSACIITSLVASTFGQVGDLAASLLKRTVGIKDYSNLIPGHGGAMDRVDSLLFSVPVTWFMLYIWNII